jgi:probable F420-dependent oxidoreductase
VTGAHPDRFTDRHLGFATPPYLYDSQFHEPFTLFAYLSALTTRIEFATSILILPQRQTALVAKQAAEVDLLSGQRLRLGVGVGWNFTEYESLNEDFNTRGRRQEEQITVLRKLWTEELVTFKGRWHTFDRVGLAPRPPRPIPIWFGGGMSDSLMQRVARLGDGWMPLPAPGQDPAPMVARLREHLVREGRDVASFGVQMNLSIESGRDTEWVNGAGRLQAVGVTHLGVGGYVRGVKPMDALHRAMAAMEAIRAAVP